MKCVLAGLSLAQCFIYLDDISLSTSFEDHYEHLENVLLTKLGEAKLKFKPTKYHFTQWQVQYLGHLISVDGVAVDLSKHIGNNVLSSPYRCAGSMGIPWFTGFCIHCTALVQIDQKECERFQWNSQGQQVFDQLNQLLVNPPTLAYLQFDTPFVVHTDVSDHAIGRVLNQVQDGIVLLHTGVGNWGRLS